MIFAVRKSTMIVLQNDHIITFVKQIHNSKLITEIPEYLQNELWLPSASWENGMAGDIFCLYHLRATVK